MELLLLWYSFCLSSRSRDEGSVSAVSTLLFGRRSTLHCLQRAERDRERVGCQRDWRMWLISIRPDLIFKPGNTETKYHFGCLSLSRLKKTDFKFGSIAVEGNIKDVETGSVFSRLKMGSLCHVVGTTASLGDVSLFLYRNKIGLLQ